MKNINFKLQNSACDQIAKKRERRQVDKDDEEEAPATIEVFSGLYVNEATDLPPDTDSVTKEKVFNFIY